MIVDNEDELDAVLGYVRTSTKTLLIPVYTDANLHPAVNRISLLYIYTEDAIERIIPIHHTEQIRGFSERLSDFLNLKGIYVHDKKNWLISGGNEDCYDVKTLWWYTYGEAYDDSHYFQTAHKFYWRRHTNLQHINAIIPIMQHAAMCQKIRQYAWPMIMNAEQSESYLSFNSRYPRVFAAIERTGLCVNEQFQSPQLVTNNKVYSHYHYHTVTGRPSNAFRGFNFAAMNKEDGTRDAFCSAHGALVEMDFDAYHVRLIARLIKYDLPETSVHTYFGRFYFDTDTLTDEQYEQSKQITFRLFYGGIDKEFLQIPFFQQVNDLVWSLWHRYKKNGYILTPIEKRPITMEGVERVTANKLFNYYLQALETEVSVRKMERVTEYLSDKQSKLVLYTYDSLLFDVATTEAKQIVPTLRTLLEDGNFPVKVKYGSIYSKMKSI
jgi:hypothetical protein